MTILDPFAERYLHAFRSHLGNTPVAEHRDAVDEIARHIADAMSAGQPLDAILSSLGPPEVLAQAYGKAPAVSSSEPHARWTWAPVLTMAGLLTLGGIPALLITMTLGVLGIGFLVTGLGLSAAGLATLGGFLPAGAGLNGSPLGAVIVGPVFAAVGALAIAAPIGCWWLAREAARQLLPLRA
jgi:uncharacterized membrane protein